MKSPQSTYLVTRTHGLLRHLLKQNDLDLINNAKNLKVAIELIPKSEYIRIAQIPYVDAATLEKIFLEKMVERFYFVVKITSRNTQKFFQTYSSKFEIENIKRILHAKHEGETIQEEDLIPLSKEYIQVNFSALMKTRNIREAVELMRLTDYRHLLNDLGLYDKYDMISVLEASLDKNY